MRRKSNLRRYISKVIVDSNSMKKQKLPYVDSYQYCQYNEEISKKFYKFLDLGLSLQFEVYEENENIVLTLNLPDTNNSVYPPNYNGPTKAYSDECVTFYINRVSFKITRNHMDICGYMDPNIYDLYQNKIKQFYEKRCSELFHKTISEILDLVPSIGREFKIDEIFND